MEPKVIFEDEEILVLDKPAGITVNKSETTVGEMTVQEWVEKKLRVESGKLKIDEETDFYKRAGIVHRLDKETSGILLVAKTPDTFENLQKQFKERVVKKTYIALAHGKIDEETGEIRVPIGRLPWNRKRFGVLAGGREAVTKFKVYPFDELRAKLKVNNEDLTLLEVYPETGRTHQIRVHLKYFGHPIFSDSLYAGRKTSRNDRKLLNRVFLHAAKISFHHPKTGESVSFESPLPKELQEFLDKLQS